MATDALPLEPADYQRWQRLALGVGVGGLVLCALGGLLHPDAFFRSYLWSYTFYLGIALGCLVLVMLQFLTGGAWGLVLRRVFEAASRTLPVLALLFVPLLFGLHRLYIWTDPEVVAHDHELQFKTRWWLNEPFFIGRAVGYFAIWMIITWLLNRWSVAEDRPDASDPRRLRRISAAGLVLYGLTITGAAIDWVMSLEPRWVSSLFGALFGIGQVLSGMAFAVIVLVLLADRPPLAGIVGKPFLRDFGSLLLAFVMVWAYMAFSQFLLIWSGNLPMEIAYYLRRFQGGWQWLALALVLFQFALPFVLLLSRDVKRNPRTLITVAGVVLAMRAVDLLWLIVPAQPGADGKNVVDMWPSFSGLLAGVGALVGIGGVWLATFLWQLQRRRVLPQYDPLMAEALHHE